MEVVNSLAVFLLLVYESKMKVSYYETSITVNVVLQFLLTLLYLFCQTQFSNLSDYKLQLFFQHQPLNPKCNQDLCKQP